MSIEDGESNLQRHRDQREEECYQEIRAQSEDDLAGHCPTIWDGLLCWSKQSPNSTITQDCPDYVHGVVRNATASKTCTSDEEWYFHPDKNATWTNYSNCFPLPTHNVLQDWVPVIKTMSQVGYGISFVTLLLAFFILISIKKLRCPRNTLHIHLFLSFMFRAFVSLLKQCLFVEGIGLPASIERDTEHSLVFKHDQPNWECKLVTSLWEYFLVANYTWILMEGLYLHNLIFLAPFSDSSAITLYVILGWGCPLLVVGSWVIARSTLEDTYCWTTHDNKDLFLIIRIPIIVSIVLNFLFFLNIVRVLLLKLQSAVSFETRKYRYSKWAKSTLVLVPLFGVHYMLFLWMSTYIGENPVMEIVWLFCDQLFASFQGFFVSILYCLINGEVRSELNKKWNKWRSEAESKNVWVPLNQISSKFYHRSTHEDLLVHNRSADQGSRHRFSAHSTCCGGGGRRSSKTEHGDNVKSEAHQLSPTRTTQVEDHHLSDPITMEIEHQYAIPVKNGGSCEQYLSNSDESYENSMNLSNDKDKMSFHINLHSPRMSSLITPN